MLEPGRMLGIDLKTARTAWTYALVLLALVVVFLVRKTLIAFVVAMLFAYLVLPLVDAIDKWCPWRTRIPALLCPFVLIFAIVTVFGLAIKPHVRNEVNQLTAQIKDPNFKQRLAAWSPLGLPIGEDIVDNYSISQVLGLMPQFGRAARTAAREVLNFFVIPLLSFFFLKDGQRIRNRLVEIVDRSKGGRNALPDGQRTLEGILVRAHVLLLQYMRALLFLCLATLLSFTIVLGLLHVPYAILLALVAFPLEFIPLAGPLMAAAIILGVCEFNHYPHLIWVGVFLVVYRLFQDYILSPHLMNKGVQLHPLLVIFGIFAGGELGGIGGIFLSVPVLALFRMLFYTWHDRQFTQETKELVQYAR